MPTPPPLSDEQRRAALEKAAEARRVRAELKADLQAGTVSLQEVFARSAEAHAWMQQWLTVDRLRALLPEAADLEIERHDLANIWSINFVIHGLLQEGVAASTRQDGQAKSLGEWFRARHAEIPVALLPDD